MKYIQCRILFLVIGICLTSKSIYCQTSRSIIGNIPVPRGYERIAQGSNSFGYWLRKGPLKADKTVYLYNGQKKINQSAQFAVLNISVGNKDLQQCADAVIRLRAEYLYSCGYYSAISFQATDGSWMNYSDWMKGCRFINQQGKLQKRLIAEASQSRSSFEKYLETVFSYAGTLSLSRQLQSVASLQEIKLGDVFIKGGTPGHAVIVVDVAQNETGEKIFLLAQSYMPAQDIHVLKNPSSSVLSPWYSTKFTDELVTPEWIFEKGQLARFK